jgi:cytochrome c oxidase assembly factor CtaG
MLRLMLILAHSDRPHGFADLWDQWGNDPLVTLCLMLSSWLYLHGLIAMWREAGVGHGVKRWEAWCFVGGMATLFIALVSPLHPWGSALFSVHMTQHELLMLVAAPQLVLGRPMIPFLKVLPTRWSHAVGRLSNTGPWRVSWAFISNAYVAWVIHLVALWVWHIPALFDATLDNEWIHAAQHTSFLGSALLFWWAVLHAPRRAATYGVAILYMFTTAMHSGLLGALITFAGEPWYTPYIDTAPNWGLTPMEDQQLGGLIMWIPAGLIYVIAGLLFVVGWLRESEGRAIAFEQTLLGKS